MDHGKKIAEGTSGELKRMIRNTETVTIEMEEPDSDLMETMQKLENAYEVKWEAGKLKIYLAGGEHNLLNIMDLLRTSGIRFGQVTSELPTLNDVFLTITGKELRDKD